MNDREKILAAAVAAMGILWGANQGWEKYQVTLEKNINAQQNVAQKLSTARTAKLRGQRAQQKLRRWQRQSLPTDPDIAKSLYQDWLQQQLTTAGLTVKELNLRSSQASSTSYRQFSFVVNATGKLEQLTDFLYRFYQAPHLHRISKADLMPTEDRKSLTITLTIDALSLAETDRKNQLADGTHEEFKQTLDQFRNSIVGRNLFATYQPNKTAQESASSKEDEATQAKFSGINYGQDGWQMSVRLEKSGKVSYFREGDTIEIGQFKGTIEQLDGERRLVIVSTESGRVQIRLGQTLSESEPLSESVL
ncbi:MAG: hypothetical protein GXP24_14350 [Planctomycetes bacterium]|nr:hypothetical protein [Planctomycetota bacterium]